MDYNNSFSIIFLLFIFLLFLWIGAQFPLEKFLSYGRILIFYYYSVCVCVLLSRPSYRILTAHRSVGQAFTFCYIIIFHLHSGESVIAFWLVVSQLYSLFLFSVLSTISSFILFFGLLVSSLYLSGEIALSVEIHFFGKRIIGLWRALLPGVLQVSLSCGITFRKLSVRFIKRSRCWQRSYYYRIICLWKSIIIGHLLIEKAFS